MSPAEPPPDRRSPWFGGAPLWLWAAPVMVACGNFGLLLAISAPFSPIAVRGADRFVEDVYQSLGGGSAADAVIMAALTFPAVLPGAAFLLRRHGPTGRGWKYAAIYAAAAWAVVTLGAVGMLTALRELL